MEKLGQTSDRFQFFLAFADEIMDGYGLLLSCVNRNQSKETSSEPRPLSYNERLLVSAAASPYFMFPNISPFYNNKLGTGFVMTHCGKTAGNYSLNLMSRVIVVCL
ncbi:MAG: hypothetical protein ABJB85_12300 [Nitrososphaerota archaeon]